ncbi:MAG: InlB B-repeat-containing protein [Lachnospiraceae bacterium]|nr:InlB B-repeat-containing protein [Lachnospiraceae bacterium]
MSLLLAVGAVPVRAVEVPKDLKVSVEASGSAGSEVSIEASGSAGSEVNVQTSGSAGSEVSVQTSGSAGSEVNAEADDSEDIPENVGGADPEDPQVNAEADDPEDILEAVGAENTRDVTERDTVWGEQGLVTWYKVVPTASSSAGVTINDRIKVMGTVNLILTDGLTLLSKGGINVPEGSELIIHGGKEGTGCLQASVGHLYSHAVIGGNFSEGTGDITINGGLIDIYVSGSCAAMIGSGAPGIGGKITVNGGEIKTKYNEKSSGRFSGAGIGAGDGGSTGDIIINGGVIETAGGHSLPGIGSDSYSSNDHYDITINGGKISAQGGSFAPGIGGDVDETRTVININGGVIDARGGSFGAGIGGGLQDSCYKVNISGGDITAVGGNTAAGIGGGQDGSGGKITIKGDANVTATSTANEYGSGVGIGKGMERSFSGLDNGVLEVEDGLVVYGGPDDNPTDVIRWANNDYARYRCMIVKKGTIPPVKVEIECGEKMTASGNLLQTGLTAEMEPVKLIADSGYSFETFEDKAYNGVTVTWTNNKVVTVSGIPTADTVIKMSDIVSLADSKEETIKVTFKVEDGSWDDGTRDDKTLTLKGFEGEIRLSPDQIPEAGNKPDVGFSEGQWDAEVDEEIRGGDKTFTYIYERNADNNKYYKPAYKYKEFEKFIEDDTTIQIAGVRSTVLDQVANWYVIGYDKDEKTVLLLARESFGYSPWYKYYSDSDLRKKTESLIDEDQPLYSIRNRLAEGKTGGKVPYILNIDEAEELSQEKLTGYGTRWWLRSDASYSKPIVMLTGGKGKISTVVKDYSYSTYEYDAPSDKGCAYDCYAIRPVINLKLDSLNYNAEKKVLYTDPDDLALNEDDISVGLENTIPVTIAVEDGDTTCGNIIWSSSDSKVVKLYKDEGGTDEIGSEPYDGGVVFAKGICLGNAVVTATNASDPAMSDSCKIKVDEYIYDFCLDKRKIEGKTYTTYPLTAKMDYNVNLTQRPDRRVMWEVYELDGNGKDYIKLYEDRQCKKEIKTGWVDNSTVYVRAEPPKDAATDSSMSVLIFVTSKADPTCHSFCHAIISNNTLMTHLYQLKTDNSRIFLGGLKQYAIKQYYPWMVIDIDPANKVVTLLGAEDYNICKYWSGSRPDVKFEWMGPNDIRWSNLLKVHEKLTDGCFGSQRDAIVDMTDEYPEIRIKGFFSLSKAEVENSDINNLRGNSGNWWLRTRVDKTDNQTYYYNGNASNPYISQTSATDLKALRPAIKLKMDYLDYDSARRILTVHYDSGIFLDQKSITLEQGTMAKLTASPKIYYDDTKLIWNCSNENIVLYADEDCTRAVDSEATDVRTVYVKGLVDGTTVINVVSNATPYISEDCSITIKKTPDAYSGFDTLNRKDQTVTIQGVQYENKDVEWYVIGFDSKNDTVSLLSKECFGKSVFSGPDYEGSELKRYVEGLTGEGQPLAPVKDSLAIIDARNPAVTGKVPYIPSVKEVNALSKAKKTGDGERWWTRSQVSGADSAVYSIQGNKGVLETRIMDGEQHGVRPVINLSVKSLIFDVETNIFKFENGVSLDKRREEVKGGNTVIITALTDEEKVHWESDSEDLELYSREDLSEPVSPGVTTAKKIYAVPYVGGTFTVTVTGKDSEKTASCEIVSIMDKVEYNGDKTDSVIVSCKRESNGMKFELPEIPKGAVYGENGVVGGETPELISGTPTISENTLLCNITGQDEGVSATITIPVTGADSYKDYEVVVTVTTAEKADAGVSLNEGNRIIKVYGDEAFDLKAGVDNEGTGQVNESWSIGDESIATVSDDGKITVLSPGETTVTYRYESDTTFGEKSIAFEVIKAALIVTANDDDITYGDEPAGAGVSYQGFVNNETKAVVSGVPDYDFSYSRYGDVGEDYSITPKGLTADNYDLIYMPGKLRVFPKSVGIRWGTREFSYDGTEKCPTATAAGLLNGDECTLTVTGGEKAAGTYTAKVTGLSNTNYKIPAFNTTTFTIAKADTGFTSPVAKTDLVYTGMPIELVTAGTAEYGWMGYALGSDDQNSPEDKYFTKDIPTALDAGTYYIWYRVYGDSNHSDVAPQNIKAEIKKKEYYNVEISLDVPDGTGIETSVDLKQYLKEYIGSEFTVSGIVAEDGDLSSLSFRQGEYAPAVDDDGILRFITDSESGGKGKIELTAVRDLITCTVVINIKAYEKTTRIYFNDTEAETPARGVEAEELSEYTAKQKGKKVQVSMEVKTVKEPSDSKVQTRMENAIKEIFGVEEYNSGDVAYTCFDINIKKKVDDKAEETVTDLSDVIKIGLKYDLTNKYFPTVFRDHKGKTKELSLLYEKPESKTDYQDGTYYIDYDSNMILIYSRYFSTYSLAYSVVNFNFLTFDMGEKDVENEPEPVMVRMGMRAQRPSSDPVTEGCIFTGWYKEESCENLFDFNVPLMEDTTVYAGWREKKKLTVSFDANGKECSYCPKDKEVEEGDPVEEPAGKPLTEGFKFSGWYKESECKTLYDFKTAVTEDIRLYAGWEIVEPEFSDESLWNLYEDTSDHEYEVQGINTETMVLNSNPDSKNYYDARISGSVITVKVTGNRMLAANNPILDFDLGTEGVIQYILPVTYKKPVLKLSSTSGKIRKGTESVLYTTLLVKNTRGFYEPYDMTDVKISETGLGALKLENDGTICISSSAAGSGKIRISKDDWDEIRPLDFNYSIKESNKDLLEVNLRNQKNVIVNKNAKGQVLSYDLTLNGVTPDSSEVKIIDRKNTGLAAISDDGKLEVSYKSGVEAGNYTVTLEAGNAKVNVKIIVTEKDLNESVTAKIKRKYDVVTGQGMVVEPKLNDVGGEIMSVSIEESGFTGSLDNSGNILIDYDGDAYDVGNLDMGDLTLGLYISGIDGRVILKLNKVKASRSVPTATAADVVIPSSAKQSEGTVIGTANILSTYKTASGEDRMIYPVKTEITDTKNVVAKMNETDISEVNIEKLTGKSGTVSVKLTYSGGATKTVKIKVRGNE